MSPIGEGWAAAAAILFAAAMPTEVWRWLGVALGRTIDPDSAVLGWVRAVATGIIAAFVAKVVFLPTGALAATPLWLRLLALAVGIAAFALGGRIVIVGCGAAMVSIALGRFLWV